MTWCPHLHFCYLIFAVVLICPSLSFANSEWDQFKSTYIENGRVIDKAQNGITHTEGQGMALLLAVQNDDPKTFALLWNWTQQNLQVRGDKLFAWSWSPNSGINDMNNASDGDLFIAWALSKAYKRWNEPRYLFAAIQVSQSIREKLLRKTEKGTVLLPGAIGFEKPEGLKLNLSYWVFPAITDLSNTDPSPQWEELRNTGLQLIQEARFGKWNLPPDWLNLQNNVITPIDGERFGYDAVRIPLYLIWGQLATPSTIKPFQSFWGSFSGKPVLPAWVDLNNGEAGTYNASAGFQSIAAMTLAYPNLDSIQLPSFNPSQGYYSSMLSLFTKMTLEDLKK
ncbi:glycosyl hydrolase family 5 [Polynucleobacter sp. AP-Capit-er-40B-B4]|uniref:glycosyl hydrolase family 8 n=1 Tax=Polynucleobacter sp. AP-Capit-er-40B-B4 TaxID=2576927 RepID=UPI001C0AE17E|nr:glycosyl hydrolase family 8 [Polynucleobacter sp. AP-Capit-er-40B-B4]MBU3582269.1 glycosyl hydrolase family 5 [Polynucleobacter sp. AP-Capit-er-40B-B4]